MEPTAVHWILILLSSSSLDSSPILWPNELTDYPDCGEVGTEDNVECLWDCQWLDNPLYLKTAQVRDDTDAFVQKTLNSPRYVSDLSCLADCGAIRECLARGPYQDPDTFLICVISLGIGGPEQLAKGTEIKSTTDVMIYESCVVHKFLETGQSCHNLRFRQKRLDGQASFPSSGLEDSRTLGQYPWACSVRTPGYRGRHVCGATLLSAPPRVTILATAAHCNYLCKDEADQVVETCCCRTLDNTASCRNVSSFCGANPKLKPANPEDFIVICGEWFTGVIPEQRSPEEEVVLHITKIINHPGYNLLDGPIGGGDIAVYHVDDTPLKSKVWRKKLYPACLPKSFNTRGRRGIFAAWKEPYPDYIGKFYLKNTGNFSVYSREHEILRHTAMEELECRDPAWMNSSTYHPAGVFCALDPSYKTCLDTGDSGSGFILSNSVVNGTKRHSWMGPLSFYRGCDAWLYNSSGGAAGQNPGVFTQGNCYLNWVAQQYGLTYFGPKSCNPPTGSMEQRDKRDCRTRGGSPCLFNTGMKLENGVAWDRCRMISDFGGYVRMRFECLVDEEGGRSTCPNYCIGVDPAAIVAGGYAVLDTTSLASQGLVKVHAGEEQCPAYFCRIGEMCCSLVYQGKNRGFTCPPSQNAC